MNRALWWTQGDRDGASLKGSLYTFRGCRYQASVVRLSIVLLLVLSCDRSCAPPASKPEDLLLEGARYVALEGGERIHFFDDESPPYFSMTAPYTPIELSFESPNSRNFTITSTQARGERVRANVSTSTPTAGIEGRLVVGAQRFRVRFVPAPCAWPQLAQVIKLRQSDPERALSVLEPQLGKLGGLTLLAGHVQRLKLLRATSSKRYPAALRDWGDAAERLGVQSEHSRALRAQAFHHFYARRFRQAQALLDQAESIDRSIENRAGLVRAQYYRSLIFAELGHYRRALRTAERGMAAAQTAGMDADVLYFAKSQSATLMEVGRYAEAWALLERVRRLIVHVPPALVGPYYSDRGWILARGMASGAFNQDWARVDRELEHARHALQSVPGSGAQTAIVVTNQLFVRYSAGDIEGCKRLLRQLASTLAPPAHVAVFTALMRGHIAKDRPKEAKRHYTEALRLALEESSGAVSDLTWRARYGLARTADAAGRAREAEAHFLAAIAQLETLTRRTQLAKDRATFVDDRQRIFIDAVDAFLRSGRLGLALTTADRARSHVFRVLYVRAKIDRLDEEARLAWRKSLDRYQEERAVLNARLKEEALVPLEKRQAYRRKTAVMSADLEARFDASFAFLEESRSPLFAERPTLEGIQSALGPDDALLVPWTVSTPPVWFGVRRGGIVRLDRRPTEPWWRENRSPPSHPDRRGTHLYVATMAKAPWPILGNPSTAQAWLERAKITFVPFPSALRSPAKPKDVNTVVIVADPSSNLPLARKEGLAVAARFENPAIFLGKQASRAAVLDAINKTDLFHFAGHGVLNAKDPWRTHLLLADDEPLTLEDLFASRPQVRHVVLSGCETGRAAQLSTTVRIGLPEAFIAAGAESVLATTREVSDAEAKRFIEHFYQAGGAKNPAQAYRQAALSSKGDVRFAFYLLGARW